MINRHAAPMSHGRSVTGRDHLIGHEPATTMTREYGSDTSKTGPKHGDFHGRTQVSQAPGRHATSPYYTWGASTPPKSSATFLLTGRTVLGFLGIPYVLAEMTRRYMRNSVIWARWSRGSRELSHDVPFSPVVEPAVHVWDL